MKLLARRAVRPRTRTILLALSTFLALTLPAHAQTSAYPQVNVAGSFNGWETMIPNMQLIADNTWQSDLTITNRFFEFKFATPDFAQDWGENNPPNTNLHLSGTAEYQGSNIRVTNGADNSQFRFTFNTSTREYTVFLLNNLWTNLLHNGGFEQPGSAANRARHWQQNVPNLHGGYAGSAERRDSTPTYPARSGLRLGMILGTWAGLGDSGSFWQEVPAEPGVAYEAAAWFAADGPPNAWTAGVQQLALEYYDFNKTNLLASTTLDLVGIPTNWVPRTLSATAPAGAAWARVVIHVAQAGSVGALRVDDVEIYAVTARRTQDFNDWAFAAADACYSRAGWIVCTGRTVSTVLVGGHLIPLARSGHAASLPNPGVVTKGAFIQSPRFMNGIGTISFWYRHGHVDTNSEPDNPVSFEVQSSFLGDVWTTVGALSNIYNTTYRPYSLFQYVTSPRYVRIVHAGGSTNRLLIDDISIALPETLPRLMDFNTWPDPGTNAGSHTYLEWQVSTGRVSEADALEGKSALVFGSETSNTWLRAPQFSDGVGAISFSYRVTPLSARSAGLSLESSPDGTTWTVRDTIPNIAAVTWQDYARPFFLPGSNYFRFRILPETNLSDIAIIRIQEPFDGGSQPPAGWTFNSIGQYTSADYSGQNPPSLQFNSTSSFVITPSFVLPTNAQFMTRGASISPDSTFTVQGRIGTNWVTVIVYTNLTNTKIIRNLPLSTNITALKFSYWKVAGNLAFDDLLVTGPKRYEGAAPPQHVMFDNVRIEAPVEYRIQDFDSWPLKMDFTSGTTQHQHWVLGGLSRVNTNKAYSGQSLQLSRASATASYYVDFEGPGETKTSYASGTVNLSGINWDLTEALIGTLDADWKNGARSARLRGYGTSVMTMLADKADGLGTITFYYRRYGTDPQTSWMVQYSTNAGATWTQVGPTFTAPANDIVQTFSQAVDVPGNVRIRIKEATGSGSSNRRLNIDDITLTGYGAGPGSDSYVQSHFFPDGIGSVSFRYRHWMDAAPPAGSVMRARIQTSANGLDWVTNATLHISGTTYQAYDNYLYLTNRHYFRLLLDQGNSVALFDDFVIAKPQLPATVQLRGWNEPSVPFTNDAVALKAQTFPAYGARNLSVTSYYRIGTSGTYQALAMAVDGSIWTSTNTIPPQPVGTIVQYYFRCDFQGPGSTLNSPVYYPTNYATHPAWYGIPRNPPGRVWINEIDYRSYQADWFGWGKSNGMEFVELAGVAGVDISGWKIELRDGTTSEFKLFDSYTLPGGTIMSNLTNGFGFYVLGMTNIPVPPRDLALTNYLSDHIPGAVRLLNEMNGIEHALAYGGAVPAHTRIPPTDIEMGLNWGGACTNSLILTGVGATYSHFAWTNGAPSPGIANTGQIFAAPGLIAASPTNLAFAYIAGSYSPAAQALTISNAGATSLDYTLATNASWLAVSPAVVSDVAPGSSVVHTVFVNTGGLTGNKSALITISGNAGNSPFTVPVQLTQIGLGDALLDYPFNESIGETAFNQGTVGGAGDLGFQNGITRTLEGGGVSSKSGDFALLSTGAANHARSVGAVTGLNNLAQFTLTGWIRTTGTGGVHRLFGNRALTNGFALLTSSNYQNLALVSSATGSPAAVTSTNGAFANGTWQFFAVTFDAWDAGNSAVRFYRGATNSGVFQFSAHPRGSLGATGVSTGRLFVAGDGVNSFCGLLDDFRLYNGVKDLMALEAIRREGIEAGGDVLIPPEIIQQPEGLTNAAYTFAQIGVTAVGTPAPVYQWRKGGLELPGKTESTITFNPITLDDAGEYDVIVWNLAGSVTSQVAGVVVLSAPEVVRQPYSQTAYAGETVYFPVNATGTPPMHYQWKWGGTNLAGATNAMLTLTNVMTHQAGVYLLSISNRVATTNTVPVTLTVWYLGEGSLMSLPAAGTGIVLRWGSLSNRTYDILWSSNLMAGTEGFIPIATNLPATPSLNWYTDKVYGVQGRGFYRFRSNKAP